MKAQIPILPPPSRSAKSEMFITQVPKNMCLKLAWANTTSKDATIRAEKGQKQKMPTGSQGTELTVPRPKTAESVYVVQTATSTCTVLFGSRFAD